MKRESTDALRARLLADEQVHSMIEMRAYEIYELRGGAPGHEAEDWIQAEAEILKFLIEEEIRRNELARGFSDHIAAPVSPGTEFETSIFVAVAQTDQAASQNLEATELASPLGLADFLTDRISSIDPAPVEDHPKTARKTRSRAIPAKSPLTRKETGEKTARVKASARKTSTKKAGDSESKKTGKKPKKG